MDVTTVWQFGSSDSNNATNLAAIRDWWSSLSGKEVTWQPRQLPPLGEAGDLNWDAQRFDEKFVIRQPQVRGITLYWFKPNVVEEKGITPHKLELDHLHQRLYIFPQSQQDLVIAVGRAELVYQTLQVTPNQVMYDANSHRLSLRDAQQQLEVRVILSPDLVAQLKQQLGQ